MIEQRVNTKQDWTQHADVSGANCHPTIWAHNCIQKNEDKFVILNKGIVRSTHNSTVTSQNTFIHFIIENKMS